MREVKANIHESHDNAPSCVGLRKSGTGIDRFGIDATGYGVKQELACGAGLHTQHARVKR